MKKLVCAYLVLALALACAPVRAESIAFGTMMVDNCQEWVSLRDGPGTGCKRLAKVPLYALVTDAKWTPMCGDFLYCCYNGQYGYILEKYLVPWEDPEPEGEVLYQSDLGFSFIYDAGLMTVDAASSEDGQSVLIEAESEEGPAYLELLTAQSVGKAPGEYLTENAPEDAELYEDQTHAGASLSWFRKPYAHNAGLTQTYCVIEDGTQGLAAVGIWPEAENETWEDAFLSLLRSVSFQDPLPIRADWAQKTKNALVVDKNGEYVSITAKEALHDVTLLSLDFSGIDNEGRVLYDTEVLRSIGEMGPDAPLILRIAFPGDFPSCGIRFTDGAGRTRQADLAISGLDGSLVLTEF